MYASMTGSSHLCSNVLVANDADASANYDRSASRLASLALAPSSTLLAGADRVIVLAGAACLKRVTLGHPLPSAARQLFLQLRTHLHA